MPCTCRKIIKQLAPLLMAMSFTSITAANTLPLLGDYSSSIISLKTEYNLGQGIIREIRGANQSIDDPIVEAYVRDLTLELVPSSQLTDQRVSIAVIGNLSVNAFAAPGGVLGIHAGIILTAQSEAELASVISHELAHLSQRHFAEQLERQRINTPFAIASLLTGILVAVANPELGTAVLTSTTASQASSQLAFSRKNEQEADHIGMLNLSKAGFDPMAMPNMFSRLLELQRLQGSSPPEFLLTHPSSSSRVSDSKNRALSLTNQRKGNNDIDFSIVQARIQVKYFLRQKHPLNHFKTKAKQDPSSINNFTYALALANAHHYQESIAIFAKLPSLWRKHIFVRLSLAQILTESSQLTKAQKTLHSLNKIYPDNSAVQLLLARNHLAGQQPGKAATVLTQLTKHDPDNADAWYLLAEAQGLAGQKVLLHIARIEYFQLVGQVQRAKKQLSFARREQSLTPKESYILDDLEVHLEQVESYFKTKF
ncbi:MAG: M48 family metallopeptidase [Oceanospirillaceae bacterium]|nr:M48 family metallopeptidase [Oceanospirillaceae bacterium]